MPFLTTPLMTPLLYLDPSSGSILLQLLIAGLAGIGLIVGTSWKKIKLFFRKGKSEPKEDTEEEYDD
jgi:hypothetical protein